MQGKGRYWKLVEAIGRRENKRKIMGWDKKFIYRKDLKFYSFL
jgi:hypothetical protein